jgi:hypothetical protein
VIAALGLAVALLRPAPALAVEEIADQEVAEAELEAA